jgi:hypothetical protein
MGTFIVEMDQADIARLSSSDVIFVLMVHENSQASRDYERHIIQHLLPRVSFDGLKVESVWGSDPYDSSIPFSILERNGFTGGAYQATTCHLNAGRGYTGISIVLQKRVFGKTVMSIPEPEYREVGKKASWLKRLFRKS